MALRGLIEAGRPGLCLQVMAFAVAVPGLMRLKLPALDRLLERRIAAGTGAKPGDPAVLLDCIESVLLLGAPLVRPGCLTRGLTRYYFLRRAGMNVTLQFGARLRNHQWVAEPGHCWLEREGGPFLERVDPYLSATPVFRLPLSVKASAIRPAPAAR